MTKVLLRFLVAAVAPVCAIAAPPEDTDTGVHSASLANVAKYEDATPADLSADATYLMPGFIDKDITLDNLRRRFGKANVKPQMLDGAEGEPSKGIVLFGADPARRAELFIRDEERNRGIASIRVSGKSSRWHFANGVRLGLTLDELVRLNGRPITFNGLEWDYGGIVTDWHGGRLAQVDGADPFYSVQLNVVSGAGDAIPIGEGDYRSDDAKFPKQGTLLYVGEIGVSFADPDGD